MVARLGAAEVKLVELAREGVAAAPSGDGGPQGEGGVALRWGEAISRG